MKKEITHIVIKIEDAMKYLTEVEQKSLETIVNTISKGRAEEGKNPSNNYYICNVDEPYAKIVEGVIIGGEYAKREGKE